MRVHIPVVGVVGLGAMGAGIVEVLAKSGRRVVAVDAADEFVQRGIGILDASLARAVSKGKLSEDAAAQIKGRVDFGTDRSRLADVDLVIEAVPENLELKKSIFADLESIVRDDAILATNTSSLSITAIAETMQHPERVVGIHFFNPAPVMAFVEVITTRLTDPAIGRAAFDLAVDCGKKPILIGDRAGFVANYLLLGYLNQAVKLLESGAYSRDDIDASMKEIAGLPMGPFVLMDLVGNDVSLPVLETIYAETSRPEHAPAGLLVDVVAQGKLGRKSGQGFYTYENGAAADAGAGTPRQEIVDVLTDSYLAEAIGMLDDGYATAEDIDLAMTAGCGYPIGPISLARQRGLV